MTDDLVIPVAPSTARIAMDSIVRPAAGSGDPTEALAQIGKIFDGRDGGTNPLSVHPDGSAFATTEMTFLAHGVADIGQASYDPGELVGSVSPAYGYPHPQGFYRIAFALIVDLSGAPLPTGLRAVLFPEDPTPGLVSVADGDALAATSFGAGIAATILFDAATIAAGVGKHPLYANAAVVNPAGGIPWGMISSSTATLDGETRVLPHVGFVAGAAPASPPSGPLVLALMAELVSTVQIASA